MRFLLVICCAFALTACPPKALQKSNIPADAKVLGMCEGVKAIATAIVYNQFDQLAGSAHKAGPPTYNTKIWVAGFDDQYVNNDGKNMMYFAHTTTSFTSMRDMLQDCILGEREPGPAKGGFKIVGQGVIIDIKEGGGWYTGGTSIYITKEKLD